MSLKTLGNSSQPGFVMPVEVDAEYSSNKLLIMLIVLGVLVAIFMFIYYKQHHRTTKTQQELIETMPIVITNLTETPHNLELSSKKRILIEPGQNANLTVPYGSIIKNFSFLSSGEMLQDSFKVLSNDPAIKKIQFYITHSGIRPLSSISTNVKFVNKGSYPVMFVERSSSNGRRWASDIVPPQSETTKEFVGNNTMWEVVHPTDEDNPIAKVTLGIKNQAVVFDGKTLVSM